MEKIKQPSVAGSFYTDDKENLITQIETFKNESKNFYEYPTRMVVVPHAGLVYSGRLAYEGINQLDKSAKNIFIFAPAHRVAFDGLALSSYEGWTTPLGDIEVNQDICSELLNEFGANYNDDALAPEHSIEVQLPIIQSVFHDAKIVPILIGKENSDKVEKIIEKYYTNRENVFVISSDLSHYMSDFDARKVDGMTAQMIENGNVENFRTEQACGAIAIIGAINFAKKQGYSFIRIDMTNSSKTTNDFSNVVGYGCWFMYEGEKNKFIEENYHNFPIDLAKLVIKNTFQNQTVTINYPQVFDQNGACFVTLEKYGELRGCIGSIIAHKPLVNDLLENARSAAFKDFRFNPVTADELDDLNIAVSILSEPKEIEFKDEADLINQIVPFKDGIIIRDGQYQAVYLPSVWEIIEEKEDFLNSLKVKAGLSEDYFSTTFKAYRFEATYLKEPQI